MRGPQEEPSYLPMARAYAGEAIRPLAEGPGYWPVVPPRWHRKVKGDYDTALYRRRNEVERIFGRLKEFRRISTRYDKLAPRYLSFVLLARILELLNRPFSGKSLTLIQGDA